MKIETSRLKQPRNFGNIKDMTDLTFGHLKVVKFVGVHPYKRGITKAVWLCKCNCGNETLAIGTDLRVGDTTSCGCRQGHRNELSGRRFGKLTAIGFVRRNARGKAIWLCKCDCGKEVEIQAQGLVGGRTKTCGRHAIGNDSSGRKIYEHSTKRDLMGQRFGRLMVLGYAGSKPNKAGGAEAIWLCKCDCGNVKDVPKQRLTKGHTKSCGCIQSEISANKLKNAYNVLYEEYRKGANKRNLSFELSLEEFTQMVTQNCHYCGDEPSNGGQKGGKVARKYSGIDRMNNGMGYVASNCVSCCKPCNIMKRTMTVEQFMSRIERIYKHQTVVAQ